VPLRQLAGELEPALGRSGQLTQHNSARDRCRIGVAVLLGRVARAPPAAATASACLGRRAVVVAGGRIR
jgi:hypothetical protein